MFTFIIVSFVFLKKCTIFVAVWKLQPKTIWSWMQKLKQAIYYVRRAHYTIRARKKLVNDPHDKCVCVNSH